MRPGPHPASVLHPPSAKSGSAGRPPHLPQGLPGSLDNRGSESKGQGPWDRSVTPAARGKGWRGGAPRGETCLLTPTPSTGLAGHLEAAWQVPCRAQALAGSLPHPSLSGPQHPPGCGPRTA